MKKVVCILCIIAILFLCLAGLFIGTGHAATTSSKKKNAFGAVTITSDPNVTLVASLLGGEVHMDNDGRLGYNLRLHPRHTYGLFDESVMFCGDVRGMLENKSTTFLAYTYRKAASRLIDGVPCHQLIGIDEVPNERIQ
jgi:hypothetical protein